ncbi:hypothetical protein K501DRAFT_262976 [Backusella circina FSU 941]|nr:hypothetical protein K501DRAFT_262976 [Backusella circina FSU 941]
MQGLLLKHSIAVQRRALHQSRSCLAEKVATFDVQSVAKSFELSPAVLSQALTHKSFKHGKVPSNERLQYVGRRSLEYFTVEANINAKATDLQNKVRQTLDTQQLATKFDSLGLESGVQCHLPTNTISPAIKSKTVEALVGAVYHEKGLNAAKEFVKKHQLI